MEGVGDGDPDDDGACPTRELHWTLASLDLRCTMKVRLLLAWDSLEAFGRLFEPGVLEFVPIRGSVLVVWSGALDENRRGEPKRRKAVRDVEEPGGVPAIGDEGGGGPSGSLGEDAGGGPSEGG